MSQGAIDDEDEGETVVITAVAGSPRAIRVAPSDIDTCIGFSTTRCVATILGLLLVLTDIPRTGFGLSSMKDYVTVVGLDTILYFGPYAYHVLHVVKQENATFYDASAGITTDAIDVWAYKFDSLSIPTRALAAHLNVTMYPRCVLYLEPCSDTTLPLGTTFTMLDGMISAVIKQYFSAPNASVAFHFVTKSQWIDRLHHFLVKPFARHTELRTHSVHYFAPSVVHDQAHLRICHPRWYRFSQSDQLMLCNLPVQWMSAHPERGASVQVPIWEHLALRLQSLKTQYPELQLDLTVITSQLVLWNKSWVYLPIVRYAAQTLEISTIVRGQRCVTATTGEDPETPILNCSTVFVDDYRYERALVLNDAEGWYTSTTLLRGAGQLFIWIRIASLALGCYAARTVELKFHRAKWYTKLYYTASALIKIPSHVIIYGNWLPIVCYAVAHFIDGALIHLISNTVWSTVNGAIDFQPVKYFTIASIQMRNIWFVALYLKLATIAYQKVLLAAQAPAHVAY
uniref:Uncharacterized protein n=1 Tax=Globisporangium ultimum (strain ATCC 200006 / CBS 805.95 / DAOM BR144) TaxID=431595 RepID=K3X397_GLOUD